MKPPEDDRRRRILAAVARPLRPATLLAHAGLDDAEAGAVVPPLHLSTISRHDHPDAFGYSRSRNPTRSRLEAAVAALDRGGHAVAFASGLAALAAVLEAVVPVGGRVVGPLPGYSGTRTLLGRLSDRGRLRADLVDASDLEAVTAAVDGADLCIVEAMSNPLLGVPDLPAVAAAAHRASARLCVDATFATPLLLRPLEHGADLVVHSLSKYAGGHSDLVAGAVVVDDEGLAERLRDWQVHGGAVPGQLECWLCLRGLRTLEVRVGRQVATAALLAQRLSRHPAVERVLYPGLPSHPDHQRARRLFSAGFGAVIAIEVRGGAELAEALCREVSVWTHATSLGGVESTLERRARYADEEGVAVNLVRLSVGLEDPEDLWEDLAGALDRVAAAG